MTPLLFSAKAHCTQGNLSTTLTTLLPSRALTSAEHLGVGPFTLDGGSWATCVVQPAIETNIGGIINLLVLGSLGRKGRNIRPKMGLVSFWSQRDGDYFVLVGVASVALASRRVRGRHFIYPCYRPVWAREHVQAPNPGTYDCLQHRRPGRQRTGPREQTKKASWPFLVVGSACRNNWQPPRATIPRVTSL